ncbi:hypothetical protein [Neisseria cinerea]
MEEDKIAESKKRYEKEKRAHRGVSFNRDTEQELLDFVDKVNFSQWVKEKIRVEMQK